MKIEIKQSRLTRQWHGNIIAPNGEIIYTQESVHNRKDAIDTAMALRHTGLHCIIEVFETDGSITVM